MGRLYINLNQIFYKHELQYSSVHALVQHKCNRHITTITLYTKIRNKAQFEAQFKDQVKE